MAAVDEILSLSDGARFHRADLHIHTFGGSHDVKDTTITPTALVQAALAEGLAVIAVTDHNEIKNVSAALVAAKGTGLTVIPGVELSTLQGHLLCYLPTLEALEKFFNQLTIGDRGKNTSNCQQSIPDCLDALDKQGGFGVLAHVDGDGGFERAAPGGKTPHRRAVVCHKALLGLELKTSTSDVYFSDVDSNADRAALGKERIKALGLGSSQFLARVLNSDAHTLKALGRNAKGDRKVTRLKMDKPSFSAMRLAFEDADARVRIEEEIPDSTPYVLGLAVEGGFLDGVKIHFSRNLNCIVGGRGTGKSTTFEAVTCLIEGTNASDVVDSDIWPAKLHLFWEDQAGDRHTLHRPFQSEVENVDDPDHGPTSFDIECYRQGETARIRAEAQSNPVALLSYLDRFVDIDSYVEEEDAARQTLLDLQTQIEKAQKNVLAIPTTTQDLKTTEKQLEALERANAKDVIALQRKLESERALRGQISLKLTEMKDLIHGQDPESMIKEIEELADPADLAVGAAHFSAIVAKAKEFGATAKTTLTSTSKGFDGFQRVADTNLAAWKLKETDALAKIEAKKKELLGQGIKLDMAYIQKLAKNEAALKASLKVLKTWEPHLKDLERKYIAAAKARWSARAKIATARTAYAKQTSNTLGAVLEDLTVSLKFLESSYSPDAESQIATAMNWRTSQVPRAALLIEQLTLPGLLEAVAKNDLTKLMSVKTTEGTVLFSRPEATRIVEALRNQTVRFALDRAEAYDLPKLNVTAFVVAKGGKSLPSTRDFKKLSFGQQQSVLLALMLSSKSNIPLIIDQPEDNLDGEFIYRTLVPVLRLAKERRQIIVVTHNANIAVLGDAEQIIVLKSTQEAGRITNFGSIDDVGTRDAACAVLEGAKEAFRRRASIYGVL